MECKNRLIILAHCFLNEKSKVKKYCIDHDANIEEVLKILLDNEIGMIQLPCPEITCYGLRRWGHVKEQFCTPNYRKHCRKIFEIYLEQIQEYIKNDYEIIAIVGIEGSPSCGVNKTCSGEWGGEISSNSNLNKILSTIREIEDKGVFIEEIGKMMKENGINVPFIDFNKNDIKGFIEKLKAIL
ncbi:CD3072 family TudS-related putative desulfidase [Paramaledivibacter caminithermalis]|jgi:predicted secreted protein|uniref:Predicted secreted protein n=1 Tax=Paramaledivibacter caminithermalis (strain DSM 15212 / CIP 107654 / DViRD3) TaxID=1121301 RepID=A0A1M6QVD6_PARC5|nr:CD3072 family TudS-related putative desulfidase [Paramaledivibacter caminithermalis]SHK24166.1 Predicted secreted protein [Paramaledivibacter caminithermalis DSM 15212]